VVKAARILTCVSAAIFPPDIIRHPRSTEPAPLVVFGLQRRSSRLLRVPRIDRRLGTPRGPLQEAAPASGSSRLAAPRDTTMSNASLAGCSILICEDESLIALGIADAFSHAGARVLKARSLADALIAIEEVPSAVILDHALTEARVRSSANA
jgi:hypothetical protein